MDYYYKFLDQNHALDFFRSYGLTVVYYQHDDVSDTDIQIEKIITTTHQYSLWEVGEIPGNEGWHVNLRAIDPDFDVAFLEPYVVTPTHPHCVWA